MGLHSRRLSHGDLKLENVVAQRARRTARSGSSCSTRDPIACGRARAPRTVARSCSRPPPARRPSPPSRSRAASPTRSDVYSFGALAYELVSGKSPFGELALDAAFGHLSRDAAPPSSVRPRGWVARVAAGTPPGTDRARRRHARDVVGSSPAGLHPAGLRGVGRARGPAPWVPRAPPSASERRWASSATARNQSCRDRSAAGGASVVVVGPGPALPSVSSRRTSAWPAWRARSPVTWAMTWRA